MLTKEEYEKTLSRIIDSVRIKNGLSTTGSLDCTDINLSNCKDTCPLHYLCTGFDRYYSPFLFIEEVEKWGKKHPVVTNREKWKEVFGSAKIPVCFKANREDPCDEHGCSCIRCKYGVNGEYHAPECVKK